MATCFLVPSWSDPLGICVIHGPIWACPQALPSVSRTERRNDLPPVLGHTGRMAKQVIHPDEETRTYAIGIDVYDNGYYMSVQDPGGNVHKRVFTDKYSLSSYIESVLEDAYIPSIREAKLVEKL